MEKPKVSIIIPVKNGEKTLKACLDSVLDQTYSNYEVIVVDNGSKDNTKDIIKSFSKNNVKYLSESRSGRGRARNKGISKAVGEIIVMTDADCEVPNNWLKEITKPITRENEDAVLGSEKDPANNYWTRNIQKASELFLIRNTKDKRHINHIDTKNFAVKASIIKEIMFDPEIYCMEDFGLYVRLNKRLKIRFLPEIKVVHRHKNSFLDFIASNVERAYWVGIICRKYRINSRFHPMVESFSFFNLFLLPAWLLVQLFKRPLGEFYFLVISEISWRIGLSKILIYNYFKQ